MPATVYEDFVTSSVSGVLQSSVIDTAQMKALVFEVRWSLSAAPTTVSCALNGTNEPGVTPDVWIVTDGGAQPNLTPASPPGTDVNGTLQASGRGLIYAKTMPRYAQLTMVVTGSFTGSFSIRAFGWKD